MVPKKETNNEKNISLSQRIQEIIESTKKEFGEESASTLEDSGKCGRNSLSTGSLLLDRITDTNGFVYGTIVEIFGQPGVGKSTLALQAIRECQKQEKMTAYIDLENKLGKNNDYAKNIGVKTEEVIKFEAQGGEEVFSFIDKGIEAGVSLFVIDSVPALVSKAHLEKGPEGQGIASKARLISERLPITNLKMRGKEVILIFINQVREDLSSGLFGPKITTPGGWTLDFHASLRIMLKPKEILQKGTERIGTKIQATIMKNSFGFQGKKAELEIIFGKGIQKEREIVDLATELNIIQKSGNWYSYKEHKLGNGKENVTDYFVENPQFCEKIEKEVSKKLDENKIKAKL
ncbi:MAG: Protein RecA [Mycoplasmataceae bacterium]|nr:MAG: Protein RecA [Mycoplasmataceae bacterium]